MEDFLIILIDHQERQRRMSPEILFQVLRCRMRGIAATGVSHDALRRIFGKEPVNAAVVHKLQMPGCRGDERMCCKEALQKSHHQA